MKRTIKDVTELKNVGAKGKMSEAEESFYSIERKPEEKKSFSERWAEMNKEEKKQYFKDYMFWPIVIGIIVVIILIRVAIGLFNNAGVVKYHVCVTQKQYVDEEKLRSLLDELHDSWDFGRFELVELTVPVGAPSASGNATTVTSTLFDNFMYADKMDACIGTKDELEALGYYFENFDYYMPDLVADIPQDALVRMEFYDQDPDAEDPQLMNTRCALRLKDTVLAECIPENSEYADDLIIVLPPTSTNVEKEARGKMFVKYLFGI